VLAGQMEVVYLEPLWLGRHATASMGPCPGVLAHAGLAISKCEPCRVESAHLCVDNRLVVGGPLCIGLIIRPVLPLYTWQHRWLYRLLDRWCDLLPIEGEHLAV
jgi:hypothetical protein